jgi:hypothetical protein
LFPLATAIGNYVAASATMTLVAVPTAINNGNRVGLALLEKHYFYEVPPGEDSLTMIATGIAAAFRSDPDFSNQSRRGCNHHLEV